MDTRASKKDVTKRLDGSPTQRREDAGESLSQEGHYPKYLLIGRVRAPRGIRGELKVGVYPEDVARLEALREVYLSTDGTHLVRFEVRRARFFAGQLLLSLNGIEDRNAAEQWPGALVYVPKEALPLSEDEYYYHQIEGLTVITSEGELLGRVTEILPTGANDVYVVRGSEGEILLPAIKQVILRVDLAAGIMVVKLMDGLR